jgi:hypothetical protein
MDSLKAQGFYKSWVFNFFADIYEPNKKKEPLHFAALLQNIDV